MCWRLREADNRSVCAHVLIRLGEYADAATAGCPAAPDAGGVRSTSSGNEHRSSCVILLLACPLSGPGSETRLLKERAVSKRDRGQYHTPRRCPIFVRNSSVGREHATSEWTRHGESFYDLGVPMRSFAGKVKRKLVDVWGRHHVGPLYSPDPADLDRQRHLDEALQWLKRAQDAGTDRGVAYGVMFGQDFDASYPETTGYICQTFVQQAQVSGDTDLLRRAIEMADWEIAIQLPEGAVMGGRINAHPTPAVFNTGMVLLGWSALIGRTGEDRFKQAARRASDWLVSIQETDGTWVRGHSQYSNAGSTLYNVKAAWGLCEAGKALGEERYIRAAVRNAEYCLSRQMPNGWLPDCCLSDPLLPLLHTLAYSMQGLIGIGKITGRGDLIDCARRLADAEIRIMRSDGFIPGRQDSTFRPAVEWCCLTGSAQTSMVWSELYLLTHEEKYRAAVLRINRYLMARHDIRNPDLRLRGGVPGSWPVWGDYGRLRILNWATKFLVDALALEAKISS